MSDKQGKRKAEKLEVFDILVNDADEVLFAIDARDIKPAKPRMIFFDSGVILARSGEDAVYMAEIPDHLLEKIGACKEVLVAETNESGIVRDYVVPVQSKKAAVD
ncbi:MAG: hypothetical protein Alpg2KO_16940 [Alphaproteobacteria bacterium]